MITNRIGWEIVVIGEWRKLLSKLFDVSNARLLPIRISSYLIRWGMGLALGAEDLEKIRDFDYSMGVILGLTNDYFSWAIEKDQKTDRVRNAVRVLMKQHGLSEQPAQSLLRGIIIDEEERACHLKCQVLASSPSNNIAEYIKAIELYVGGSCYWHATAPRYRTL